MTWLRAATFIDGRAAGIPYGSEVLRRARARTLAAPGLQLRLRAHPRLGAETLPPMRAETLLDALLDVAAIEPHESEVVDGAVVVRFATLLRACSPVRMLAADVWLDGHLQIRRIAAVPASGRASARLRRTMTGRIPLRRCWTLEVAIPRTVVSERRLHAG